MDMKMAASTNNNFGINLFKTIAKEKGQENIFVSPFSISIALAMTHLGAIEETARGMETALCWPKDDVETIHTQYKSYLQLLQKSQNNFSLSTANRVYIQKSFPVLQEFVEKTKSFYLADPVSADFIEAAESERVAINKWVEEKTQNKIKDLIQPGILDALTRMVLVNAIHFKGNWDIKFKESATAARTFKTAPGKEISTQMMNAKEKYSTAHSKQLKCRAIEIPYKGKDLSMVIILPEEEFGLQTLIGNLTQENLQALLKNVSGPARSKVQFTMPKFEVTSSHSLKEILTTLGMADAFSLDNADFSGMTGKRDLCLSAVIHKAFVKVDEEGTEAAAATAAVMMMRCAMVDMTPPFIVDHPFLYLIRDKRGGEDGTILFMGIINDPSIH